MTNYTLHNDLQIPMVNERAVSHYNKFRFKFHFNQNPLISYVINHHPKRSSKETEKKIAEKFPHLKTKLKLIS